MLKYINQISNQCKISFISTIFWGLITHGIMFTNKLSWHDDISALFNIGSTVQSGRWMLEVINNIGEFVYGSMYSTPMYNGFLCLLFLGIVVALIIDLLEIKNYLLCAIMGMMMVSFPVIAGMFGYMFTAPAYMFGLLLGIIGVWLICKYKKLDIYFFATLLCCCCVAIYQAFIPVVISLIIIFLVKVNYRDDDKSVIDIIKEILYYALFCIIFMVMYFVTNKVALFVCKTELLEYSGIKNMGVTSVSGYIQRIGIAYQEFFAPYFGKTANMYPGKIEILYRIVLVVIVSTAILLTLDKMKKNIVSGIYWGMLLGILPLATNFVYVMCEISAIHTLTVYGKAFVVVYFIWLMEQLDLSDMKCNKLLSKTGVIVVLMISIVHSKYDNICYLKAEMQQMQTINYFTVLVSQIKSTDGYKDELPVVFLNQESKKDDAIINIPEFDDIIILPYSTDIINGPSWISYLNRWTGYSPVILEENIVEDWEEVERMPSYPDYGAIKIINDIVVVKF